MPDVSIVIPTYNHQDYVLSALESVFSQTFTDYEVIVINDGSPDNTSDVLRPLADSGKIRYIEQLNAGQSAARNRGIAEAKGEFIALLDDDDIWPPDKLENQIRVLWANPDAALVYGKAQFIDENGELFEAIDAEGERHPKIASIPLCCIQGGPTGQVYDQFNRDNYIVSPGLCLIRRSSLRELGESAFDPEIKGGADDWDLYLRLSQKHPFIFQAKDALYYRVHRSNASRDISKMLGSIVLLRRKMYRVSATGEDKEKQLLFLNDASTLYVSSLLGSKTSLPLLQRLAVLCVMARYLPRAMFWRIRESISIARHVKQ